ncbi:hypothetical protein JZ751_028750 [Albula glossodonta]|uniref:Uncharacterized protein n=1 Tax=Albula glossodonta TaxID=121402 RepID=A0A8T2NIJ8_9TELE|nr:hypothetical protein JZ751_028750 [Albula glossodonta]
MRHGFRERLTEQNPEQEVRNPGVSSSFSEVWGPEGLQGRRTDLVGELDGQLYPGLGPTARAEGIKPAPQHHCGHHSHSGLFTVALVSVVNSAAGVSVVTVTTVVAVVTIVVVFGVMATAAVLWPLCQLWQSTA